MPDFLSYDPDSGLKRMFDYDEMTGTAYIRTEHDAQPMPDRALAARNEGIYDGNRWMKHYADLTPIVQMELRQKGLDIYSKDEAMMRKVFQEINRNYPYCKLTYKTHE